MSVEIPGDLKNIVDNEDNIKVAIVAMLTSPVIATLIAIYPMIKEMLRRIFIWIKGEGFRYTISRRVNNESGKDFGDRYLRTLIEMWLIAGCLFLMTFYIYWFDLLIKIQIGELQAYICVIVMVVIIGAAYIVRKLRKKVLGAIYATFTLGLLAVMYVTFVAENAKPVLVTLSITTLAGMVAIIYGLYKVGNYESYKYGVVKATRAARYILAGIWIFYVYINLEPIEDKVIAYIWVFLVVFEYLFIGWKNQSLYVEKEIYLKTERRLTKNEIVQCAGGKVSYILLDGTEELVDVKEIECVLYRYKPLILKRKTIGKVQTTCFWNDGTAEEFEKYCFIKDDWIRLERSIGKEREVKIVPIGRVKKTIKRRFLV